MKWTPVDIIVIILTTVISIVLATSIVDVIINDTTMTDIRSKRITALLTSIIAIITLYVGAQIQKNKDK